MSKDIKGISQCLVALVSSPIQYLGHTDSDPTQGLVSPDVGPYLSSPPLLSVCVNPKQPIPSSSSSSSSSTQLNSAWGVMTKLSHSFNAPVRIMAVACNKMWCAGRDGYLRVYSLKTYELLHQSSESLYDNKMTCITEVKSKINATTLRGKKKIKILTHVWVGTENGVILVYEDKTYQCIKQLRRHAGSVLCLSPGKPHPNPTLPNSTS